MNIGKILLCTTMGVYGEGVRESGDPPVITEDLSLQPSDFYGSSKRVCEEVAAFYYRRHGIRTTLVSGVVLVEIAGASGAEVDTVLEAGRTSALTLLGGLAFLIGLILFGIATMQARVFPRWAGLLLIVGDRTGAKGGGRL
jgi:hypothetical protein